MLATAFRARRRHSARVFWRVLTEIRLCLRAVGCLRGLDPEYPLVGSLPFRRLSLAGLERRRISVKTIQETPFPLAGRRLVGSVEARLPSVGSVLARSNPVRGRGLGSAPGASASSARMLGRCPKGALLQRRRNSLKFGLAQWEGSGIILTCALKRTVFLGSSTAEHPAVNRRVVGSNPTRGAMKPQARSNALLAFFFSELRRRNAIPKPAWRRAAQGPGADRSRRVGQTGGRGTHGRFGQGSGAQERTP